MSLKLNQCVYCAQLDNGHAPVNPCRNIAGHKWEPLSRATLAAALGSTGGRPKKYATEEERLAARRETFNNSNRRRREKLNPES